MILACVVRVCIPLRGQLLARPSFPSKLPFYFWAAEPVGGNTQSRMDGFEPAFLGGGMTYLRLLCSAGVQTLFSRPPGAIT